MLRPLAYFIGHATISLGFVVLSMLIGPSQTHGDVPVRVLLFVTIQLVSVGIIVAYTAIGGRWFPLVLALPATLWTLWCGFIAMMAYSGVWL